MKKLGALLKARRKARQLTQKQVESLTGITQGTISKIERGLTNSAFIDIIKLMALLKVKMRDVAGFFDEEQ